MIDYTRDSIKEGMDMDEIDIAVLDMSAFEFKIECHDAHKHEGEGMLMHRGPSDATHLIYSTCANCGLKSAETNVCLSFIEEAYDDSPVLKWKCGACLSPDNRYSTTLTIVGCL